MFVIPLDQILEPDAKNRIARLALVKKEKARSIEDSLINAARNGKLKSKVIAFPKLTADYWYFNLIFDKR